MSIEHARLQDALVDTRPSIVDGIAHRLRHSDNKELKTSTFLGFHHRESPYPVLLPEELWASGMWIVGAARSGKTHMALNPIATQRIRRDDRPVVIIDFKGDDVLFHSMRREAKRAGRTFKHFTNVSHFSTYLFNPLAQRNFRQLTIPQLCQVLLNALNLWHGFAYGAFFFSSQSRAALGHALRLKPRGDSHGHGGWVRTRETRHIRSFEELEDCVEQTVEKKFGGAEGLVMVVRELANILQLNFPLKDRELPQSAIDNAIHIPDLFVPDANGQYPVVYFYLRSESELIGASQVAKLFVYGLQNARKQQHDLWKAGRAPCPPEIPVFIDEWQMMADSSICNMLEQGGGLGLHFVLANQDISQLMRGDTDLLATIWENAGNKLIFTARSPEFQDRIMKVSGEKAVHLPSYQITHRSFQDGHVTPEHALEIVDGSYLPIQMQEQRTSLIERNDLIEMSDAPRRFMFIPAQGASVAQFGGYPLMLNGEFLFTKEEYDKLDELPWPDPTAETIVPADLQPKRPQR